LKVALAVLAAIHAVITARATAISNLRVTLSLSAEQLFGEIDKVCPPGKCE
jgi:hypothetical protein